MINKILWADSRMCRKTSLVLLSLVQIITYRKYDAVMFTIPSFHQIFKLIFHKQPTNLEPFLQVFLEQTFRRIRVNSCVVWDLFPR